MPTEEVATPGAATIAGLARFLEIGEERTAKATFFMTGHFASYYPGWARRVAAHFAVCNHTMNHLALVPLPDGEVRAEVASGARAIRRAAGKRPQPLFRFPYGVYDARTLRLVNSLGYAAIGWTVDTGVTGATGLWTATDTTWTANGAMTCARLMAIYCIEQ